MDSFFHADTARYVKIRRILLAIIIVPLSQLSLLGIISLLLNARALSDGETFRGMLFGIGGLIAGGMLAVWFVAEKTARLVQRHSRLTYFDIGLKAMVYSEYAGEYCLFGEVTVLRKLTVIRFSDFKDAVSDKKSGNIKIVGKARVYLGESDGMGYHFRGGDLVFDRFLYNDEGFTETDGFTVKRRFGKKKSLCAAINEAKKRFDSIPPKKEYVFHEAEFIRRRPKKRELPDDLNFSHNWQ